MNSRQLRILMLGVAALAGCQERHVVIVGQRGEGIPVPIRAAPQCAPPWGSGPFSPMDGLLSREPISIPPRALAAHVSGCAGVRFRVGPDGMAHDVEVLREYPAGYGFGDALKTVIQTARWAPRTDEAWHYINETITAIHRS